ncbi:MAG TPA: hypothetical protein VMF14_23535 [Solirubrobacteraceae bacterium]|nr:hypothetical protein [Solirubrobacteraceae bacterium]
MSRSRRIAALVLTVAGAVLAVAGCGGSAPSHPRASDALLARSQCMRAHGIGNYPDPVRVNGSEGFPGTIRGSDGSLTVEGITFSGPAFRAAEQACPQGGAAHGATLSGRQKQAFVAQARCIRTHGVPGFPDPIFGPAGFGVRVPLRTGQNPDSPAILRAEKACAKVGTPLPGV